MEKSDVNLENTILVWTDLEYLLTKMLEALGRDVDDLNYVAFVPKNCEFPVYWESDGITEFTEVPFEGGTIYLGKH